MKKIVLYLLSVLTIILIILACSKEDNGNETVNSVPVVEDQSFNALENIDDIKVIGSISAYDPNGDDITFSLTKNNDDLFEITEDGDLSLANGAKLDFQTKSLHLLGVTVGDGKGSSSATIRVTVLEFIPENLPPQIEDQEFSVKENIDDTITIGVIEATDPDEGTELTFSISTDDKDLFEIDNNSGEISLIEGKKLDFETEQEHILLVSVTDQNSSVEGQVTITVVDVNEHPEITSSIKFEAPENITDESAIGEVSSIDPEGQPVTYEILANDNDLFEIDPTSGELSLSQGKTLNYEDKSSHKITIRFTDGTYFIDSQMTIEVIDINEPPIPIGENFVFEANENVDYDNIIGIIAASDPENDLLNYTVQIDDHNIFEISNDGSISLVEGKEMDFEASNEHNITVRISDGELNLDVNVTVIVLDAVLAEDPSSFITKWRFDSPHLELKIGYQQNFVYDFTVEWGDGQTEDIFIVNPEEFTSFKHTYSTPGKYTVAIQGVFPGMRNSIFTSKNNLTSMEQWGNIAWGTLALMFNNCRNMDYNAADQPNLFNVTSMAELFDEVEIFNTDITGWDTSKIENMTYAFKDAASFNQNIGSWEVGNVTTMFGIFDNSGLSPENYSAILVEWASQAPNVQQNVDLGALGISYCLDYPGIDQAIETLTVTYGWTISDAGGINCN